MNSYFEQSGFYGQGGGAGAPDYRFPIGLSSLGGVSAYGQHQPRPPQDTGYDAPASPSKSSLYSSLSDPSPYRSKTENIFENFRFISSKLFVLYLVNFSFYI